MTCLSPPNPLFKGAHQGLRAHLSKGMKKRIQEIFIIDIWVEIDIGCYLYLKNVERIERISKTRGEAFRKVYAS